MGDILSSLRQGEPSLPEPLQKANSSVELVTEENECCHVVSCCAHGKTSLPCWLRFTDRNGRGKNTYRNLGILFPDVIENSEDDSVNPKFKNYELALRTDLDDGKARWGDRVCCDWFISFCTTNPLTQIVLHNPLSSLRWDFRVILCLVYFLYIFIMVDFDPEPIVKETYHFNEQKFCAENPDLLERKNEIERDLQQMEAKRKESEKFWDEENDKFEKELEKLKQSFGNSLSVERPKIRVKETKRRYLAAQIDATDGKIAKKRIGKIWNRTATDQPDLKITKPAEKQIVQKNKDEIVENATERTGFLKRWFSEGDSGLVFNKKKENERETKYLKSMEVAGDVGEHHPSGSDDVMALESLGKTTTGDASPVVLHNASTRKSVTESGTTSTSESVKESGTTSVVAPSTGTEYEKPKSWFIPFKNNMEGKRRKTYTAVKAEEKTLKQNMQQTANKAKQLGKELTALISKKKEDLKNEKDNIIEMTRKMFDEMKNRPEEIQVKAENMWKEQYLVQQDKQNKIQEQIRKNQEERENTYKELKALRRKSYEHEEKIELEKKNYRGWVRETIYPPKSNLAEVVSPMFLIIAKFQGLLLSSLAACKCVQTRGNCCRRTAKNFSHTFVYLYLVASIAFLCFLRYKGWLIGGKTSSNFSRTIALGLALHFLKSVLMFVYKLCYGKEKISWKHYKVWKNMVYPDMVTIQKDNGMLQKMRKIAEKELQKINGKSQSGDGKV